jgi:hypothetical protein
MSSFSGASLSALRAGLLVVLLPGCVGGSGARAWKEGAGTAWVGFLVAMINGCCGFRRRKSCLWIGLPWVCVLEFGSFVCLVVGVRLVLVADDALLPRSFLIVLFSLDAPVSCFPVSSAAGATTESESPS